MKPKYYWVAYFDTDDEMQVVRAMANSEGEVRARFRPGSGYYKNVKRVVSITFDCFVKGADVKMEK